MSDFLARVLAVAFVAVVGIIAPVLTIAAALGWLANHL